MVTLIGATDLIRVDEYDLLDVQRKQDVQEENFVAPDDPLLFRLLVKPTWPLVLDQLVFETVIFRHSGKEILKNGRG